MEAHGLGDRWSRGMQARRFEFLEQGDPLDLAF